VGVLHLLAGHSGPETAADGRTHFGIFATQVWKPVSARPDHSPEFLGLQRRRSRLFCGRRNRRSRSKVGIISIEVARPDFPVAGPRQVRRHRFESRGERLLRDSRLRAQPAQARLHCYAGLQFDRESSRHSASFGTSRNNVKVIAAISEELFDRQPEAYRNSVLPPESRYDLMVVSTGTRRMWPWRCWPFDRRLLTHFRLGQPVATGGLEPEVIAEAHLDKESIAAGIERFGAIGLLGWDSRNRS